MRWPNDSYGSDGERFCRVHLCLLQREIMMWGWVDSHDKMFRKERIVCKSINLEGVKVITSPSFMKKHSFFFPKSNVYF